VAYNAGMGAKAATGMDEWLGGGGLVVTASERAARALAGEYHRARRAEGRSAWPSPQIEDWHNFVRRVWDKYGADQRMVLSPIQEQALWTEILAADGAGAALLDGPRRRTAQLAMEAHRLLCLHAPRFLRTAARAGWQQDAGVFSRWLAAFDEVCREQNVLSSSRLPLELAENLVRDAGERPGLLLAGFDRVLPTQREVFDAWGAWRESPARELTADLSFLVTGGAPEELRACALWCESQLAANPQTRLLVVSRELEQRRGEIERAFLKYCGDESTNRSPRFEFSLGVPLGQMPLVRGALLLLRWLTGAIEEHELDWLISTGQTALATEESQGLAAFARALRRRGLERTRWSLDDLSRQKPGVALPEAWVGRMRQARRRLEEVLRRQQTPLAWAELAPQLLEIAGWPGQRPPERTALTSAEFQVMRRWQSVADDCASLGFDGRQIEWRDFLGALIWAAGETLFAPESEDAPVLIAGPAEAAGLAVDGIWFLGASEDAWPAGGAMHPLLPFEVQRAAGMPHASAQLDWELAETVTRRLAASAPRVRFSYARQSEGLEMGPSRLVEKIAGGARDLPAELTVNAAPEATAVWFEDASRIPFPGGAVAGGSSVLTAQSQCAFKAFATARLGAEGWEPAQAGLSAKQRGQLLHAVLHAVWGGPPAGLLSHKDLVDKVDLRAFVEGHVHDILNREMPSSAREQMPRRYLKLEATRLVELVIDWLRYEAERVPFEVAGTEIKREMAVAGLALKLRLDRVDRLSDGSFLVIDYKTGDVSPNLWEMPRPDDVQLPLYAGFALQRETQPLGGLVFAKVRAGKRCFAGRVGDAKGLLLPGAGASCALVKRKLEVEDLLEWRDYIERMALDFIEGRADVDPREFPATCDSCGLQAVCRIAELRTRLDDEDKNGEEQEGA